MVDGLVSRVWGPETRYYGPTTGYLKPDTRYPVPGTRLQHHLCAKVDLGVKGLLLGESGAANS
jgi:hypothetical protein